MQNGKRSTTVEPLHESEDLADFVRVRRQQLHLTHREAAKLSGLSVSQWKALEAGRFPKMQDNINFIVAGTLQVSADLIGWLAASD